MTASVAARILAEAARAATRLSAMALCAVALLAARGPDGAAAADLGYAARGSGFAGYAPPPAPPPFAFAVDPRCSIVPMPQLDLTGDTARFRATAVCQSRGLYTDSLMFPGPPVLYRGYSYGRAQ
ncbi:MAG: hypothetical protein ACLPSF_05175 [Methylocella sp.]